MLGAIIGDVIGSHFEWNNYKAKDFELFSSKSRFTDDSVLTFAIADSILNGRSYENAVMSYGNAYPEAGYGGRFKKWLKGAIKGPYNSWGNGSAMRVSPVGFAFVDETELLTEAEKSASITHNHPEGIKGAQAVALSIRLLLNGNSKEAIKTRIETDFAYDLSRKLDDIRPTYQFDVSCQGSVPESIIAFLEATDFEDTIRNAVSIGGDSDTIASIAGAIASAYYPIPDTLRQNTLERLPPSLVRLLEAFEDKFIV